MKRRKRLAWRDKYRNEISEKWVALDDFWNSMCLEGILSWDFWVTNPMEIENFPFLWLPNPVIEKSLTPNAGSSSNSGYKSLTQTHHKCSPPDRVSERDSSGHRSNEACPKCSPPERASERKRGSCDGERELWRREGVVTERESCDRECDGERRSYAEGVESETGKREKELKVFESFEMY